jgi:peptidoglycan/LPS O-acetylase OafA/YrhL
LNVSDEPQFAGPPSVDTQSAVERDLFSSAASHVIPTLDGWRAVAVLSVLAYHDVREGGFGYQAASLGHHGVQLFFGISGFLITTLLVRERERRGSIDLRSFYIRRFFRIVPPVLAYLFIRSALGWVHAQNPVAPIEVLSGILFFRNYIPPSMIPHSVAGHFWSLSVEEHFYLLWPFLLVATRRTQRGLALALGLVAIVVVWRYFDSRFRVLTGVLPADLNPTQRTDTSLDGLMCGAAFALAVQLRGLRKIFFSSYWAWAQGPLVLLYVLVLWRQQPRLLESTVVPLLLWSTVRAPGTLVGKALSLAPVRWIGVLSYSIYIWHVPFMTGRYDALDPWTAGYRGLLWTLLVSLASYLLLEEPCRAFGRWLAVMSRSKSLLVGTSR